MVIVWTVYRNVFGIIQILPIFLVWWDVWFGDMSTLVGVSERLVAHVKGHHLMLARESLVEWTFFWNVYAVAHILTYV
jgi:hypothetical protein